MIVDVSDPRIAYGVYVLYIVSLRTDKLLGYIYIKVKPKAGLPRKGGVKRCVSNLRPLVYSHML